MLNPGVPPLPLRDIHVPEASWWPPAPGWWLLLLLAGVLLLWAARRVRRWRRRRHLWRQLSRELQAIRQTHVDGADNGQLASALSQLLRRVVRHCGGNAQLQGAAWRAELTRLQAEPLPAALEPVLGPQAFQPQPALDVAVVLGAAETCLRRLIRHRDV
ncbi:MAG TPA: DUF4381 domain-containing protein [Rhodanobacteraceae bacterium]|nr:DUF4381 domain-containing protein [Rhodanobacteraceae bacterium]